MLSEMEKVAQGWQERHRWVLVVDNWREIMATSHSDYCIIGGGVSGCLMAQRLAEAGQTVQLFEKARDSVGDKAQALRTRSFFTRTAVSSHSR